MWIDTVEFGDLNRGIDDGGGFAATLGPHEHVVFATYRDAAHRSFGCVVVEFKEGSFEWRLWADSTWRFRLAVQPSR